MKILLGLLVAGLLACANAQVQTVQNGDASIAHLASQVPAVTRDSPIETKPTQKTTQSVLQAVEAVVASLTPGGEAETPTSQPAEHAAEGTRTASPASPANEAETPTEEASPDAQPEANEAVTEPETEPPVEASEAEEEEPAEKPAIDKRFYKFLPSSVPEENLSQEATPTKKELKAIAKYNEAVDQVAAILSERLKDMGPMPLALDEETLVALDTTEPEPEPETTTQGSLRKNKNKKNKNKNKRRKNKNKNKLEETRDDVDDTEGNKRKNNNSNEKNNNSNEKNNNRSNEKNKGNNSGEKKKNKNKNKNKKNRKNKNKKNKSREDGVQRRQPKDYDDEDDMEDTEVVVQGRRKNGNPQQANRNRKNKNRNNKRKNKKNKNKKNKGRLDIESREAAGPTIPTAEERAASNAKLTGFSRIQRAGDVAVDLSGKRDEVSALLVMGPLEVQLKDKSRALTRAKVSTYMSAVAQFRVKSVRGRSKINLQEVTMSTLEPHQVSVTRDDLELEPELVNEAQSQVVQAVDVERIGRILNDELKNIFNKDNIVENLENHPFHKKN